MGARSADFFYKGGGRRKPKKRPTHKEKKAPHGAKSPHEGKKSHPPYEELRPPTGKSCFCGAGGFPGGCERLLLPTPPPPAEAHVCKHIHRITQCLFICSYIKRGPVI